MRIAISLDYAGDVKATLDQVSVYEAAGLDVVWIPEAYGYDSPTLLGYLAAATQRVQIGAGILNVYSRTPATIAQTAAGLDAISGGRALLGLGASGPQVVEGWHGMAYDRPLARTRDVVEVCRKVWRREIVEHSGATLRVPLPPEQGTGLGKPLRMINRPVRNVIPVYLAALGEKNVELAAEIAEGWLPLFYLPERAADAFGPAIARGTARRAPELGPLQIAAGGLLAIGAESERERLRDLARPQLALYVGGMGARGRNFYNDLVIRYGFEKEAAEIQELYLGGHKRDAEAAVPDELIDRTNLVGPAGFVRERIAAYQEAGVTMLNVGLVGTDPVADIEAVRSWL